MEKLTDIERNTRSVILGQKVVSIDFVKDYLVMDFPGGSLNFYTLPILIMGNREYRYEDSIIGYRAKIGDFIGCAVSRVSISDSEFRLYFSDGKIVYCLLGLDNRQVPEEVEFGSEKVWWLI